MSNGLLTFYSRHCSFCSYLKKISLVGIHLDSQEMLRTASHTHVVQ